MNEEYYVYLYRDARGRARYIGYAGRSARAAGHPSGAHNGALARLIATKGYEVQIAGPFGSEETAQAVETALISGLAPDCNAHSGETQWRFRPLGVPAAYAERMATSPPLLLEDFILLQAPSRPTSVLFVHVGDKDLDDGRPGYDPARVPSDADILRRMDRWWTLDSLAAEWAARPEGSPGLLVGVSGKPGSQIVIGAAAIDRRGWAGAARKGAYRSIPTAGPGDLDAFSLRCRRIGADAGIRFGSFTGQFFILLDENGRARGGHPVYGPGRL